MKIKVLAFAIAKEIMGGSSTMVEVNGTTVEDLQRELEKKYPSLKHLASYMIAVNSNYATANTVLQQEDEVALIPPVSGG